LESSAVFACTGRNDARAAFSATVTSSAVVRSSAAAVARTRAEVARTSGKKTKVELIAAMLRDVPPDERAIASRDEGEVAAGVLPGS